MGGEDRKEVLKLALSDYLMMIESNFPLENARFIVFREYKLNEEEKKLLQTQMLKIVEDRVRLLP